jgi:hypothetical protein
VKNMAICAPIKIGVHEITQYNSINPHEYVEKLRQKNDGDFYEECKNAVWLSAYANNNPRSDFHFMCDACYDESKKRDDGKTYERAHKAISRSI